MEPTNPLLDDFVLSLTRSEAAARAVPADGLGRHDGADQRLPSALRRSLVRARASLAVSHARQHATAARDRARAGHHLRRRRLDAQPARRSGARTGSTSCSCEAWRAGTVLAGLSAGAMCWFQGGVTRSSGPPEPLAGLGLLDGSLTVHADGEPERLPVWLASVRDGTLPGGWALDDGVGLLFKGLRIDARRQLAPWRRRAARRPGRRRARAPSLEPELLGDGGAGRARRRGRGDPGAAPRAAHAARDRRTLSAAH